MAEEIQSFKQVRSVLDSLSVDNSVKAAAFDAYFDSADPQDFQKRFDKLNLPREAKAALWDQKFGKEMKQPPVLTVPAAGRLALEEAPAIGGALGGAAMGVPGAVAGGVLGKGVQRAIRHKMGEAPPAQLGEFATDVGLEGAKQGLYQAAGPIVKFATKPFGVVAPAMYKAGLNFTPLTSLPARREAAEQGIRLGASTTERIKGLPRVQKFVDEMSAKVDAEIAKAKAAGAMIDTEKIMEPVRAQVTEYAKSLAPTKPTEAAREIERDIVLRLGGQEINVAGPGGTVVKKLVPGPRFMDPEETQVAKRATSRTLRKAYGEEKGPGVETLKAGERGAKEAMESAIPSVEDPNWQEHVALTLQDAMERALKEKPGWAKGMAPYIIGGAIAGGLTGHPIGGSITAAIAHEAIRNPAVMTRLAIWLDRAGATLPKIAGPAAKYGLRFGLPPLTEPMPPSRLQPEQR